MATFRTKLKQLRDADVRFISLVDRAATRIPFRVLKRDDKENEMGIDLMRVFKSDVPTKPVISELVVFTHPDEAVRTKIQGIIKDQGFVTDRVQKADDGETISYAQADQPKEVVIVRLGDHILASVGGLKIPKGWVGDLVEKEGFFPDLKMATSGLYEQLQKVAKSDTPQADAKAVLDSYGQYLNQLLVLPAACFGLDEAISAVVTKADPDDDEDEDEGEEEDDDKDEESEVKESETPSTEVQKSETEAEKKKRLKDHPPAEMAPPDEDDDQKGPPVTSPAEKSEKVETPSNDFQTTLLAALKGIEERTSAQLKGLSQKLETVVTEQATQKKVLDEVVQKADTLGTKLTSTVTAPPVPEDKPAHEVKMRVEKADDDPRKGNFDTAFLRRRR